MSPPDIKPVSPIRTLDRQAAATHVESWPLAEVAPAVGMSASFVKRATGKALLDADDVVKLLDQDEFCETFVQRSRVLAWLAKNQNAHFVPYPVSDIHQFWLAHSDALPLIRALEKESVQCAVTSPPYWGMRTYENPSVTRWADGETCVFGHEQTPEGYIRHSVQMLYHLAQAVKPAGSIWWNLMDTYNTRAAVRSSSAATLQVMTGKSENKWKDLPMKRYSAGHSFLHDGELCMIPSRVAERASRMGLYTKSIITWHKTHTKPDPVASRVRRMSEYVIHFSKSRAPLFDGDAYLTLPPELGGRNTPQETELLGDVWHLSPSAGSAEHGAQYPVTLPARCIALSTKPGDLVLDPFSGSGTTGAAALRLGRRYMGIDCSQAYIAASKTRLQKELCR